MNYEKTPIKRKLIRQKYVASLTKDITKLSTWRIVCHLYKRHELLLLHIALAVVFTFAIVK